MTRRLIGIDFSGSAEQWRPGRKTSNVWLAFGAIDGGRLRIDALKPVQALEGDGTPFERLIALLGTADAVVGIDASFSLPAAHVSSAPELWAAVAALAAPGRPFASGRQLIEALAPDTLPNGAKVYRACEAHWRRQRLNVRSGLWCGPRGGAAFSAACMSLLHRHSGPVWPVRPGGEGALLVEAYPAAQLRTWDLDPTRYSGAGAAARRARVAIVEALVRDHDLRAGEDHFRTCVENADALDAVICAYAAKTLAEGRHPRRLAPAARTEGWVLVDTQAARPSGVERRAAARPSEALVDSATEAFVQALFDRAFEASGGEQPALQGR